MKAIEINDKSIHELKQLLDSQTPVLMLFRMEFCPHCVALKPAWTKAKQSLARKKGIAVAEVEYEHLKLLPSHLRNIRGFPTIQMLQHGKLKEEYFGDRSASSIAEFASTYVPAAPKVVKKKT